MCIKTNYCSAMPTANEIFLAAKDGGLEELLRAGVDIDYRGSTGSHARDEVTPAAPSRVADR